jgi:hypothetical protein
MDICTAIRALAEVRLTLPPSFAKVMVSLGVVTSTIMEFPTDIVPGTTGAVELDARLPGMELAAPFRRNSNEKELPAVVTPPLIFQLIE